MPSTWFIARDNRREGPFTSEHLRQMARDHLLGPDDMVLKEGAQRWIPARSIQGLFGAGGTAVRTARQVVTTSSHAARANEVTVPPPLPQRPAESPQPQRNYLVWLGGGMMVGLAVFLAFLWGARNGATPQAAPLSNLTEDRPKVNAQPDLAALALERQRDKLLQEKLEVERQRADLERHQREATEAALRERVDAERRKREEAEANLHAREAAENAQKFSASEFDALQTAITANGDALGRMLLRGTHPTGTYASTSTPVLTLTADRCDITLSVTVHWRGGITENRYLTTYATNFNKKDGIGHLKVPQDTAIIPIHPQFLRTTEYALKEMFKQGR